MGELKILVCTHSQPVRLNNPELFPIHVGKKLSNLDLGCQGDDTGDNISEKNPHYCELTGLYWAWKNLSDYDYIGLCHYRRLFDFTRNSGLNSIFVVDSIDENEYKLNKDQILSILESYDIILPKPEVYPYNLMTDYCVCHCSPDYRVLKDVVNDLYPEYNDSFRHIMEYNNKLSHYNIFISKRDLFETYCEWVFNILGEAEKRISISNYDKVQGRIWGYMSERLLNVFVHHHSMRVKYLPILFIGDNTVNMNVSTFRRIECGITGFLLRLREKRIRRIK